MKSNNFIEFPLSEFFSESKISFEFLNDITDSGFDYNFNEILHPNIFLLKYSGISVSNIEKLRKEYFYFFENNKLLYINHISSNLEHFKLPLFNLMKLRTENDNLEVLPSVENTSNLLSLSSLDLLSILSSEIDHFNLIMSSLTESQIEILYLRSGKQTLQSIAEQNNITRERIRQIVTKTRRYFDGFLSQFMINHCGKEQYLSFSDIYTIFGTEVSNLIIYLYSRNPGYMVLEQMGKIVTTRDYNKLTDSEYHKELFLESKIDTAKLDYTIQKLNESGVLFVDYSDLDMLLQNHNYIKLGDSFHQSKSYSAPYLYVIEEFFPNGIELNQMNETEDIKRMVTIAKEIYPSVHVPRTSRALVSRITEFLLAVDRSIYISEQQVSFESDSMLPIANYIDQSEESTFYFNELYGEFEQYLKEIGISNRYYLHSIFKLFYNDEYDIIRDRINKKNVEAVTFKDRLEQYFINANGIVTKSEIVNDFKHFSEIMITMALSEVDAIVSWGYGQYIHENYLEPFSDEERTRVVSDIENILADEKYVTIKQLTRIINSIRENRLELIVDDITIDFIKHYFGELYSFQDSLLVRSDSELLNLTPINRAKHYIDSSQFDYDSVIKFTNDADWSVQQTNRFLDQIIPETIRVDLNSYIELSSIEEGAKMFREEFLREINMLLDSEVLVTPFDIIENASMSYFGFHWNTFSLVDYIDKFVSEELVHLEPLYKDRRYIQGVICRKEDYASLGEIILSHLKELNINEISEFELESYLINKNVIKYNLGDVLRQMPQSSFIDGIYYFNFEKSN